MDKRREFGNWLQKKRKEAGLSQREAAVKLGFTNSYSVVAYENGISPIPLKRLFDISTVYKIPMSELLEKLEEYEPRIHTEFLELEANFKRRFDLQFEAFRKGSTLSDIRGAEIARFHQLPLPFPAHGERPLHNRPFLGYKNIYYQTLRNNFTPMEQIEFKFSPKYADYNNVIPLFSKAPTTHDTVKRHKGFCNG